MLIYITKSLLVNLIVLQYIVLLFKPKELYDN